jgi:hypothetical protein
MQILQEKIMRNEVVLVPAQIRDNSFTCTILVEVYGGVQSVSVTVFALFNLTFVHFVFVENWIFILKKIIKIITEQIRHTSRVKTQNRTHVGSIEL